jgi:hypothetical protein
MDPRPQGAAEVARRAWLVESREADDPGWADDDWSEDFDEVVREIARTRETSRLTWVGTGLIEDLEFHQDGKTARTTLVETPSSRRF